MVSEPYVWQPLPHDDVVRLMDGFPAPWWFAGGQAIDAFLGYKSREHGDIDIACFREDQLAMQRQLSGLDLWYADAPYNFKSWRDGEVLPAHVHDIWARGSSDLPWCLQLMLDEREGQDWVYRRNPAVRRSIESLITFQNGVPYIALEVQLCTSPLALLKWRKKTPWTSRTAAIPGRSAATLACVRIAYLRVGTSVGRAVRFAGAAGKA